MFCTNSKLKENRCDILDAHLQICFYVLNIEKHYSSSLWLTTKQSASIRQQQQQILKL